MQYCIYQSLGRKHWEFTAEMGTFWHNVKRLSTSASSMTPLLGSVCLALLPRDRRRQRHREPGHQRHDNRRVAVRDAIIASYLIAAVQLTMTVSGLGAARLVLTRKRWPSRVTA
jgi:hypothetical protein